MADEKIQQPGRVQDTQPLAKGESSEVLFGGKTYQIRRKPGTNGKGRLAITFFVLAGISFLFALVVCAGVEDNLAQGTPVLVTLACLIGTFLPCVVFFIVAVQYTNRSKTDPASGGDHG